MDNNIVLLNYSVDKNRRSVTVIVIRFETDLHWNPTRQCHEYYEYIEKASGDHEATLQGTI